MKNPVKVTLSLFQQLETKTSSTAESKYTHMPDSINISVLMLGRKARPSRRPALELSKDQQERLFHKAGATTNTIMLSHFFFFLSPLTHSISNFLGFV